MTPSVDNEESGLVCLFSMWK